MIASKLICRREAKGKPSVNSAFLLFVIIDPKRVELDMGRLKVK